MMSGEMQSQHSLMMTAQTLMDLGVNLSEDDANKILSFVSRRARFSKELQEALCRYTTDTLRYNDTVKGFCKSSSTWIDKREKEMINMGDIKDRNDKIDLSITHAIKSDNKGKALGEYMKDKVTREASRRAELEEELAAVLKATLGGLEELHSFLDAVEKLAVTSPHVFTEENRVLQLPEGISPEEVQAVVRAAQIICPLLVEFKGDDSVFFTPRLQNLEVFIYQLDKYIQTTQKICEALEESQCLLMVTAQSLMDHSVNLSEDDIQTALCHIKQLDELRMDQNFRMVFLLRGVSESGFIQQFSERQPRMLQFLQKLEEAAVQLDRMNKGAKISSVAGSSVGAVGGVLSIVGLALIPFTAGVSLGLTIGGVTMGVTSGVNSLVTTATEIGVNRTQQKKASELFQSFMEDVQSLQGCLDEAITIVESNVKVALGVGRVISKAGAVGKAIDSLIDAVSAVKLLKAEQLIASAGKVVAEEGKALRNVPRVASEIPDIGQAAVKGPLALTKSARAGFIVFNALFLGMDVFFICKDSISLAKGSETAISKFIRARASLWSSEMDSWKKIYDSLCDGQETSEKKQAVLDKPFYPRK